MAYEARNYEQLLGIEGLSDPLMKNHFTLYQGYVANTNKLADALNQMLKDGKAATPEYAELKRRFGWEFNGMRLHEYYFGNMVKGGNSLDSGSELYGKLAADFGSYDNWQKDFKGTGAMRGSAGSSCTWTRSPIECATPGSVNTIQGTWPGASRC